MVSQCNLYLVDLFALQFDYPRPHYASLVDTSWDGNVLTFTKLCSDDAGGYIYPYSLTLHIYPSSLTFHRYPYSLTHLLYPYSLTLLLYPYSLIHLIYPYSLLVWFAVSLSTTATNCSMAVPSFIYLLIDTREGPTKRTEHNIAQKFKWYHL